MSIKEILGQSIFNTKKQYTSWRQLFDSLVPDPLITKKYSLGHPHSKNGFWKSALTSHQIFTEICYIILWFQNLQIILHWGIPVEKHFKRQLCASCCHPHIQLQRIKGRRESILGIGGNLEFNILCTGAGCGFLILHLHLFFDPVQWFPFISIMPQL